MTLSYLGFHALFVLPPLALLAAAAPRLDQPRRRRSAVGLTLMVAAAVAYTTPWDNYLIEVGVWWYGDGRVAARFIAAPLGEYLFFALQPVIAGLWVYVAGFDPTYREGDWDRRRRAAGALAWLGVAAVGAAMLRTDATFYLGALLAWAGPVLALQWAVGAGYLLRTPRQWGVAVAVPTLYLWVADRVAIGLGIWTISAEYTTGVYLLGLPIEEAAFFLATNMMLVYGLVLFEWVLDWRDARRAVGRRTEPAPDRPPATDVEG